MFCIIMCIFLTNVLQNLRERISAKLLDGGTRHGHALSMSSNHRSASEMPFKCFRCCIAKKEERRGGGVGDWLESPVKTHSIFVVFFLASVVVVFIRFFFFFFFWGGGGGGGGGVNC